MKRRISIILTALASALLANAVLLHAQPIPSADDCNEGRVGPPRTDPRHPYMHCLEPWGILRGSIVQCYTPDHSEEYGGRVMALGDVNHDGIADFGIQRMRCDTNFGGTVPIEWLIYHGVKGGLPSVESGERIGPSELNAKTTILCTGDWDADGNRDIAVRVQIIGDTTGHNVDEYDVTRLVIFWGNNTGQFSLSDTTQIPCEADIWVNLRSASGFDFDGDNVDDLLIWGTSGLHNDTVMQLPRIRIIRGHRGERWGRNGISRVAEWKWWASGITFNRMFSNVDQDCDGHRDVVLYDDETTTPGSISVLYGQARQFPDTTGLERIDLTAANGHYSLFTDVTGDGVPELATNCGSQEVIKLYAGKPGVRLKEQYGSGNDPADASHGRPYARPWASISLPKKVNPDDWFTSGFEPLYDLGDLNRDNINDLVTFTPGFLIEYNGGQFIDSYIDAGMRWGVIISAARLGDIDGSGVASFAIGFGGSPGGLAFYKVTDSIPPTGEYQALPHAAGFRCEHAAGVEIPAPVMPQMPALTERSSTPLPGHTP